MEYAAPAPALPPEEEHAQAEGAGNDADASDDEITVPLSIRGYAEDACVALRGKLGLCAVSGR